MMHEYFPPESKYAWKYSASRELNIAQSVEELLSLVTVAKVTFSLVVGERTDDELTQEVVFVSSQPKFRVSIA